MTAEVVINLEVYEKFRSFINGIEKYDANIKAYTIDKKRHVDAKSLIGIITLEPTKDIILSAEFEDEAKRDEFLEAMKQYQK